MEDIVTEAAMRKLAQIRSPYSYQKAYMIKNSCLFGGMIASALVTAYVYDLIGSLWLRLALAAAAAALIALLLLVFYKNGQKQLEQTLPSMSSMLPTSTKKTLLCAGVCLMLSLLLIAIAFALFRLLLPVLSPTVSIYHTLTVYGTYILAVLLYPVACLLLFQPAAYTTIALRKRVALFFSELKALYFYLLPLCVAAVLVNAAASYLISNAAVQATIAFLCSVLLWTLSWGPFLQINKKDIAAA